MRQNQLTYEELQNEHLDNLLRIAFKYEAALDAQRADQESQREYTTEEQELFQDTFARYQRMAKACNARNARAVRKARRRKQLSRILEVVACMVIIIGLSAPFAIAHVEYFRVKVMELLIDIQDDYTRLSLIEDEEAAFSVPAEWKGAYYPSYLPEGYVLHYISPAPSTVTYTDATGKTIIFKENTISCETQIDSEDTLISYSSINGNNALIIEKDQCSISWTNGDMYFIIITDEPKDIAIEIAEKIRKIP